MHPSEALKALEAFLAGGGGRQAAGRAVAGASHDNAPATDQRGDGGASHQALVLGFAVEGIEVDGQRQGDPAEGREAAGDGAGQRLTVEGTLTMTVEETAGLGGLELEQPDCGPVLNGKRSRPAGCCREEAGDMDVGGEGG